jgi:CheY-like chemotaxis protein
VDNEEVDRELLRTRLAPLGFEVAQAASGEQALALLREGLKPAAILMDLAMPGIDGWETLRRIRSQGLSDAPVAVVSANAFDKGLENDAGIAPEDFIVKPVRLAELLDWLGRRLGLQWIEAPRPTAAPAPATVQWPAAEQLKALEESVRLGYYRGVQRTLDRIEAEQPACAGFVARARALAREFQFEAMAQWLQQADA